MSEKIPKSWKWVKLGEIADVRDGTHDSPKETIDGKYLITSKHIKNGKIDFSKAYKISLDDFEAINKRSKVDKYDILFSMIGTIGEMVIVDFEPDFAIKNVGLFKTRNKDLSKWIYYYLKSNDAQAEIRASLKGSTQQYITLGDLRNFPILLPPLPEQKAIAEVLSSIDDKIELLHRQNKTLEEMAMNLFRKWFIEDAKEDWEECILDDLCLKIASGGTPSTKIKEYYDGHINWYSTKELNDCFLFESEKKITLQGLENSSAKLFPKGTIVMAIYAAPTVGRLGILANEASFNQAACGLIPNTEVCSKEFLYLYLKNERENLNTMATGSAQQNLNVNKIKTYPTIKVPKNIMIRFNKIIIPIFLKIENNSYQIQTLEKLRDTLLPKLISGEVRV